jgi:protein-disulfide isomerase/rhodanese-related sulfurtransferase
MRRYAAFALSLFGLFDSLYLWWVYTSPNHPVVCLGSGGCDEVRSSAYAHLLGVPTPAYGILLYSVLAALIFAEPLVRIPIAVWLRRAVAVVAGAGFVAGLALTMVEAFVIHAYCVWCVAQFIAVTAIFVLAVIGFRGRISEATAALAIVRVQSVVLLAAVVAGIPAFLALMHHSAASAALTSVHPVTAPAALVRADSHVFGSPNAPLTIVEFGDFQCPSCGLAEPTSERIREAYSGKVRFVFRQFPLTMIHGYAEKAAEASECAADQGKFWEAVHRLYAATGELAVPALKHYAREIGLDGPKFDRCLDTGATTSRVQRDFNDGRTLGIHATPTFIVGQQQFAGLWDFARFSRLIDSELARVGATPGPTVATEETRAAAEPKSVDTKAKQAKTVRVTNTTTNSRLTAAAPAAAPSASTSALSLRGTSNSAFGIGQSSGTDCDLDVAKQQQPTLIRTVEAQKLFARGSSLFVDVRNQSDFQQGRIQGAINVPAATVTDHLADLPKGKTIVLYESGKATGSDICAASRAAGRILLSHGYADVKVYQDGLAAWQKQGLPVER